MKKYLIINGLRAFVISSTGLARAEQTAKNYCDLAKEVIVREVNKFNDYSIKTK